MLSILLLDLLDCLSYPGTSLRPWSGLFEQERNEEVYGKYYNVADETNVDLN